MEQHNIVLLDRFAKETFKYRQLDTSVRNGIYLKHQ